MTNSYKLYADLFVSTGYTKSIIFDLSRNNYFLIDNNLAEIIAAEVIDFDQAFKKYPPKKVLNYKNFLIKNDLIQIADVSNDNFPRIEKVWLTPYKITNLVMDFESNTAEITSETFQEIGILGTEALEIRCFDEDRIGYIYELILKLSQSTEHKLNDIQVVYCLENSLNYKLINRMALIPVVSVISIYTQKKIEYEVF